MSQPNGFPSDVAPQVLSPVMPPIAWPTQPPPRRSSGVLVGLLIVFGLLGFVVVLGIVAMFTLGGSLAASDDVYIKERHHSGNARSSHKIAIVSAEDIIIDSTAKYVIRQLEAAQKDDRVKAVVLKVDSPGGTIHASDHINRAVHKLCRDPKNGETKPVIVSMQGLAASGGYYISAPATRIFAERTTLTGSIGVIASFPNLSGIMEEWKVRMEVIKTGPEKDSGSMWRPMTDAERQRFQELIGDAFERFIEVVAEGRGMEPSQVKELASGGIFTAREALKSGLVDEIGYLEDAIAAAEQEAGVTDANVIEYKRPLTLSDILLGVRANQQRSALIDLESLLHGNIPRVMYMSQGPKVGL